MPMIRSVLVVTLLLSLGACGLFQRDKSKRDTAAYLQQLQDEDEALRDSARGVLDDYLFLKGDLPDLYTALEQPHPDDNLGENSSRTRLLFVLAGVKEAQSTPFLETLYPNLANAEQKAQLLYDLGSYGTEDAASVWLRLMQSDPLPASPYADLSAAAFFENPENIALIYPGFLALRKNPGYSGKVIALLNAGLLSQSLKTDVVQDSIDMLMDWYQQAGKADRYELLTCLSFFPAHPEVNDLIIASLDSKDPELNIAGVRAAALANIPISDKQLKNMAANYGIRTELYSMLDRLSILDRFPKKYRNQQAIAEGDLASWLGSPAQRGQVPDEMEFLERKQLSGDYEGWIYFFKFRYGKEWMLGISGPQPLEKDQLVPTAYATGSDYSSVNEKSPDEIVRALSVEE